MVITYTLSAIWSPIPLKTLLSSSFLLPPSHCHPTPFKKKKKKKKPMTVHVAEPDSGSEWPVMSPVLDHGWPAFKVSDLPVLPFSEEVQALISEKEMQKEVVESCRKYFYGKMLDISEDGKEEEEEEDEEYLSDEDEEEEDDEEGEDRDFNFLRNLFVESKELREYYEKKQESGAFYCLVCGGIGVKVWKTFKGCLSLVQHCNGIGKTKRRLAHRALAQVVCQVLGWEPLGRSLTTSEQDQVGNDEKNVDHSSGGSGSASDKFVIGEASDDAGKKGGMTHLQDHVNEELVRAPGNGVDAGGCGKPVNHEALPLDNHGEDVNEGGLTLSLCTGCGKEGNVDTLANLKGDNDVGTGAVDGNPGKTTVNVLNENVED